MAMDHFWIDLYSDHLSVRYSEPGTYYLGHNTLMTVPFTIFGPSSDAIRGCSIS